MKILLYFSNFDPISKQDIEICQEANKKHDFNEIQLITNSKSTNKEIILSQLKRKELISLILPKSLKPKWYIGSFDTDIEDSSIFNIISYLNNKHINPQIYCLWNQENLSKLSDHKDFTKIINSSKIILYYFSDEADTLNIPGIYQGKSIFLLPINQPSLPNKPTSEINSTIYHPKIINFINQKGYYSKAQIKSILSPERYEHSLFVANKAKELIEIYFSSNTRYTKYEKEMMTQEAYISGIYHDICKELKPYKLIRLAKQLKINNYPSYKVLHAPIGAWYINQKYSISNQKILQAVAEHTIPLSTNPPLLTQILFIADHWNYSNNFPNKEEDVYSLLKEGKLIEIFEKFFSYSESAHPDYTYPINYLNH